VKTAFSAEAAFSGFLNIFVRGPHWQRICRISSELDSIGAAGMIPAVRV
jgi:hypothetical protein